MMASRVRIARLRPIALALLLAARAAAQECPGDCDGDGAITSAELEAGIHAIFDPSAACRASFDRDADQRVAAADLVAALRSAGGPCPIVIRSCDTQRTALPIPDGKPDLSATSAVVVTDARVIGAIAVDLQIAHAWVGDLLVTLEHAESGRRLTLLDRPGFPASPVGCSHADVRCTLEDSAGAAAEDACRNQPPALRGSLRPSAPLSGFAGELAAGTWTLRVADAVDGDTGTLQHWCLALQPAPTVTPTETPSSTPTITPTASTSATPSLTALPTATGTAAPTDTPSLSPTASPTPSDTPSPTETTTASPTPSPTASPTASPSATPSPTETPTPSPTAGESPTSEVEAGVSPAAPPAAARRRAARV
jgi:subtilisin-like proprotein convertase family protein